MTETPRRAGFWIVGSGVAAAAIAYGLGPMTWPWYPGMAASLWGALLVGREGWAMARRQPQDLWGAGDALPFGLVAVAAVLIALAQVLAVASSPWRRLFRFTPSGFDSASWLLAGSCGLVGFAAFLGLRAVGSQRHAVGREPGRAPRAFVLTAEVVIAMCIGVCIAGWIEGDTWLGPKTVPWLPTSPHRLPEGLMLGCTLAGLGVSMLAVALGPGLLRRSGQVLPAARAASGLGLFFGGFVVTNYADRSIGAAFSQSAGIGAACMTILAVLTLPLLGACAVALRDGEDAVASG